MTDVHDDGAVSAPLAGDSILGTPVGVGPGDAVRIAMRRDRLLAGLTLTVGAGFILALPFALRQGAEFFLPLTAALVIAIALVPILEWLERRGVPSALAALTCVLLFLIVANIALAAIIVPATDFFRLLPSRIGRIQANLAPLLDLYSSLEHYVNKALRQVASTPIRQLQTAAISPPSSILELAATSAPALIVQFVFGVLVVFFVLSGWTRMRQETIRGRTSFDGAMATARVIQEVVDDVSAYLGTITIINLTLGGAVAGALSLFGMPYPLMWGGIVALLNYIPYFGPVIGALLLAIGGLMTFSDIWVALAPPRDHVRHASDRGQSHHPAGRRPPPDHQPGADPDLAQLLGMGVGHDRRAAGRSAAHHPPDRAEGGGQAGHCGLPVRAWNAHPSGPSDRSGGRPGRKLKRSVDRFGRLA
jgi:predicted PurR-regulated permease PerM